MTVLPAQPNLDHLRRQARDLLRAARAGDTAAAERVHAVSDQLNLTAAQLAVAHFGIEEALMPATARSHRT